MFINNEEFKKLDFEEQQNIINQYRKNNQEKLNNRTTEMIGSEEHSAFIKNKKKIMLDDGTIVKTGLSFEEEQQNMYDKIDDIITNKPISTIKKLVRKIK